MDLASVRIFVTDIAEAARFYETVVGLTATVRSDDVIVYGKQPMIVIERVAPEDDDEKLLGRFTGIGFAVADAQALFQELTAKGIETAGPPEKQSWGGILLHAKDPSGNTITFVQS